jgi:NADPH-dependent ferric siderophore reductase
MIFNKARFTINSTTISESMTIRTADSKGTYEIMMDLTRHGGFGQENVCVVWGRYVQIGLFIHFAGPNNDGRV